jgi:hypothetical protein
MSESKFYWDGDTIDFYAEMSEKLGPFHTAFEIYKYIANECEWDGEPDFRAVYLDLLLQVENKINE